MVAFEEQEIQNPPPPPPLRTGIENVVSILSFLRDLDSCKLTNQIAQRPLS